MQKNKAKEISLMDFTEKRLNQILNLLDLMHSENTFFLGVIKNMITNQDDRKSVEEYIEKCNSQKQAILSGVYEDEIGITH